MRIGVVGAGTMGAGIAQLAAQAGAETLLHDPLADVEAAIGRIAARWERKGARHSPPAPAGALADLGGCELIVEAAPERLELKRELFAALGAIAPEAVLASNTSSIPITAIAAAAPRPELVVGMHFFNPPPVMRLLEVIPAAQTAPATTAHAVATGEAMGRRVIVCADVPGFVVNRTNRPFGLEALRLLTEQVADAATIDRILRAAGFPMGSFELQDLVGLDTTLEIQRSFHELSFGEPRWRPSPLLARTVAAGWHGRKSGRGWYRYEDGAPHRAADPEPPAAGGGDGRLVVVAGERPVAGELRDRAQAAGFDVRRPSEAGDEIALLRVDCGAAPGDRPHESGPLAVLCAAASLAVLDPGGGAVGFHALPPIGLVELVRTRSTPAAAQRTAESFFTALGLPVAWVGDAPGGVLGRIVCQLVNEACFTLGEGVAGAEQIDEGMVLGLNHPRGPLAWAQTIGLDHVLAVLDGLHAEYREERYRAAPLLRRAVAAGTGLSAAASGSHGSGDPDVSPG